MRPIHGAAPGVSAADHFTAMRDNAPLARPANPSEAVACDDLHTLMPPSRAHLKRLLRPRPYVTPATPRPTCVRDTRLDFHKAVIAQLGGSRTVVGSDEAFQPPREPGTATTLEQYRAARAVQAAADAVADVARAERKNLEWRALATGQGELLF